MDIQNKLDKRSLRIYARFFKRAGTVLSGLLYCAALIATVFYGVINFTSKNYVAYYNTMAEDRGYYERVDENIKNALEGLELPEGVTAQGIYSSIDRDEYKIFAGKYLIYICQKVFSQPEKTFSEVYETDSLDGYLSGTDDPAEIKRQITECIERTVKFLPDDKYGQTYNTVSDIFEKKTEGRFLLSDLYNIVEGSTFRFVDALLISAIIMFIIFKINQKHRKRCFYIMGSVAFLSSFAVLVPSVCIYKALSAFSVAQVNSFPRELLAIANGRTANAFIVWATVIFVISTAVFIASLAVYAPHRAKIRRSKK